MNETDRHWIMEQARKVLRPGDCDELEAALSRSVRPTSANPSGQPDASLNTGPGPSGKASELPADRGNNPGSSQAMGRAATRPGRPYLESELRELFGK